MNAPIMANDFKRLWKEAGSDILAAVSAVGESGWYVLGDQVRSFEKHLAAYWNLNYAVGVGNGMDALEIGLRILGLQPEDKVLTTPLSAFASTLAILRAGGKPVFVDVDGNGNINLELAQAAIEKHNIRFMLPVHLYGNPLDLKALASIKKAYNLLIIEDCAQSIGAKWEGMSTGTVGDIAATSFYPTKNLGALGDGGAILSSDASFAKLASHYRDYGQKEKYNHAYYALNSRLDEVQAAILEQAMLPRLNTWLQLRQSIAEQYLKGIQNPYLRLLKLTPEAKPAWHLFPIFTKTHEHREDLLQYLQKSGIGVAVHYPFIIPEQEGLCQKKFLIWEELSQAKKLAQTELSLPVHPYMTVEEINTVIEACNSWVPING